MKKKEERTIVTEVITEVICDRCDARCDWDDLIARQEWVTVSGEGGFGSKDWGDGTAWYADLCERCQYELFASFAKVG